MGTRSKFNYQKNTTLVYIYQSCNLINKIINKFLQLYQLLINRYKVETFKYICIANKKNRLLSYLLQTITALLYAAAERRFLYAMTLEVLLPVSQS